MPGSAEPTPATADGSAEIIRAAGVTRRFGSLTAVSDVSFNVSAGDIVGLAGSDGAGKTTLLRMLATMLAPSSGTIRVGGLDVVRERSGVKEMIGYMPQRFGLYPDLTVAENLDFFMDIYGIAGEERRRRRERYLGIFEPAAVRGPPLRGSLRRHEAEAGPGLRASARAPGADPG